LTIIFSLQQNLEQNAVDSRHTAVTDAIDGGTSLTHIALILETNYITLKKNF